MKPYTSRKCGDPISSFFYNSSGFDIFSIPQLFFIIYSCRFCPPTPHGEPWPLAPRFRRDGGGTPRLAATDWTADHSRGRGTPGATARRVSSWARESRRWGWWLMFVAAFLFLVSGCWDLLDLSWFIRWLLWWRWEWILKGICLIQTPTMVCLLGTLTCFGACFFQWFAPCRLIQSEQTLRL